jgi:predicted Zn-dependent protease
MGLAGLALLGPAQADPGTDLLPIMQRELQRCATVLRHKAPPGPYFMSYAVNDTDELHVSGMSGALILDHESHNRSLNVDVRAGTPQLDNTHLTAGTLNFQGTGFPIGDDDPAALQAAFFMPTEEAWRAATDQLAAIQANQAVTVRQADAAADFSDDHPAQYRGPLLHMTSTRSQWEPIVRHAAARFLDRVAIQQSQVNVSVLVNNHYFASTDGGAIQFGETMSRLDVAAMAQADDGMPVMRSVSTESRDPDKLPTGADLDRLVDQVGADVLALRQAPVMEPYAGPAILSGRAAGVFFHEIFGHRIEGHRQKGSESGQTFTHRVGQPVLPDFISVVDDPTAREFAGTDLAGAYPYDEEGMPGQKVVVVDHGVLRNFLMSRSPINGFPHSNGHGRAANYNRAVGRQGNLMVSSTVGYSDAELRRRLIELCKQQGKPFGILVADVNGGFTMTSGAAPQAFEVQPSMVYRVYVDGRPDELVRGVALIGTPLTSFSHIVACGDHAEVFNGVCGAESGPVPVSAVSPALLIEQIELQKQPVSDARPPILPPPGEKP